jgi:hypothetical protein
VADFLTASPSNEHHTAEVLEKIFHFLEACSIEKTLSKKKRAVLKVKQLQQDLSRMSSK